MKQLDERNESIIVSSFEKDLPVFYKK